MAKALDVTGGVILGRAYVEAIERAVGLRLQRVRLFGAEMPDAGAIGDVAGIALRALESAGRAAPVGAMFEFLVCESPADGAVAAAPLPCSGRRH